MALSLYLDECVDHRPARTLAARGHDVQTARSANMLGASDDDQIRYAAQRCLLIVSHNQRHFRIWHARFEREGVSHGGMLLVPFSPMDVLVLRAALMLAWIETLDSRASRSFAGTICSG